MQHMPLPWLCTFQPIQDWFSLLMNWLTTDIWLILEQLCLSIVPCNQNSSPSGPFSKGQMGNLSPLGDSLKKVCNFKANFLHPVSCKPLWLVQFWKNSKSLLFQKSTKYSLLALLRPCPPLIYLQRPRPPLINLQRPRPPPFTPVTLYSSCI